MDTRHPSGDSTADSTEKLTEEVQRNFSRRLACASRCTIREPHSGDGLKDTRARTRLAFVQLADRVLDMLTQQAALFGRHVAVTATLIEIGGNCSAHHDV
jgi:hypothetical protein